MRRHRALAVVVAVGLAAAGCGSRLSPEDRAALLAGGRGAPGSVGAANDVAAESAAGAVPVETVSGATGESGTAGPAGANRADAPLSATPKGGNGGATDVGVTATEITIAVLSDRTGPVPGIFESTVKAVTAWTNYINSRGGIHGRKIKLIPLDSKTSAADNRAGALQACKEAFAVVGSMSALDDGGAGALSNCGIPDISATVANRARDQSPVTFPAYPNVSGLYILGPKKLLADENPGVADKAAMLWLNAAVASYNAKKNMEAGSSIGYKWIYQKQVEVVEPNYTPYVVDMRNAGVQYVSMVGEPNSIARLLRAFKSQNYRPKVIEFDTVVYDPKFLQTAGDAAEGVYTSLPAVPLDEAASNPEYTLYLNSLKRSSGGNTDGFFGLYAWSAARLFQEAIEKTGPQVTRAKVLGFLQNLHSWDGHGLHTAHDIGAKRPANCFVMIKIQGGKFTRHKPATGYDCNRTPLYTVKNP